MLEIIDFTNKYQTNPPNPTSNIFRSVRVAFASAKKLRQRLLNEQGIFQHDAPPHKQSSNVIGGVGRV